MMKDKPKIKYCKTPEKAERGVILHFWGGGKRGLFVIVDVWMRMGVCMKELYMYEK